MEGRYKNLYNDVTYIPPSVIRKLEMETPNAGKAFGVSRVNRNRTIESITGQSEFNRLLNRDLLNRDVYADMKNKIMYSMSQEITDHSILNKL